MPIALDNHTNQLIQETGATAPATSHVKGSSAGDSDSGGSNALAGLIFALQDLVMTFTGTMQVFQERFQQLSDQESALSAYLKRINPDGGDDNKFQKEILEYKQQLNAVQNEQQLASVAMQGASSNESTMLAMLGNVVKIYGATLSGVAQGMSN
jgi:hypothetical protein